MRLYFSFCILRSWAGTCSTTIGRVGGASIGPWRFCATTAWATMPYGSNPCPAIDTITSIRTTTSNFPSFPFTATTTTPVAIRGLRICWRRLVRTLLRRFCGSVLPAFLRLSFSTRALFFGPTDRSLVRHELGTTIIQPRPLCCHDDFCTILTIHYLLGQLLRPPRRH